MNVHWNISRPRDTLNDDRFLEHRFRIFEQVCLPSVSAQSQQNFVWLMLFDAGLPDRFRQRVAEYTLPSPIAPVYVESRNTLLDSVRDKIHHHYHAERNFVITTSLDSDAAIAKNFVESVQNNFDNQDFEFINFSLGYLYRIQEGNLYLREWLTSPFYSLVERKEPLKELSTVLSCPHALVLKRGHRARQVIQDPIWLMSVHGANVRTNFDVNAAWQPAGTVHDVFETSLDIPRSTIWLNLRGRLNAVKDIISSKRQRDTTKVKLKKISNILAPGLMTQFKRLQFYVLKK